MDIKEVIKDDIQYTSCGDNIYKVLSPSYEKKLSSFLNQFLNIQSKEIVETIPKEEYKQLPFSASATNEQWIFRRNSYHIVSKHLKNRSSANILEIGGWNGWLTHHLGNWGHNVLSVDYFEDEVNGLAAKKHYSQQWLAIQADVSDLSFLKARFDVILVNHCLAYTQNPIAFVSSLRSLLNPGGKILLMGLTFFNNTKAKAAEIEQLKKRYREQHAFGIFLHPTKAYLGLSDKKQLETIGVAFYQYPQYNFRNFLAKLITTKPLYMYGIYEADTDLC